MIENESQVKENVVIITIYKRVSIFGDNYLKFISYIPVNRPLCEVKNTLNIAPAEGKTSTKSCPMYDTKLNLMGRL